MVCTPPISIVFISRYRKFRSVTDGFISHHVSPPLSSPFPLTVIFPSNSPLKDEIYSIHIYSAKLIPYSKKWPPSPLPPHFLQQAQNARITKFPYRPFHQHPLHFRLKSSLHPGPPPYTFFEGEGGSGGDPGCKLDLSHYSQ